MKLKKQSTQKPNFKELDGMVQMLMELLEGKDNADLTLDDLCSFQDPRGSFSLLDSDKVSSDARADFIKMPTYIGTAILMKEYQKGNSDLKDRLIKGLNFTAKTHLSGHGFDEERTRIHSLKILCKGKLIDFLENEREICPAFHAMVHNILHNYNSSLLNDITIGPWGEDYRRDWEELTNSLKTKKRLYIAYGSNMNKEQMKYRCPDSKMIGRTYLKDWKLTIPFYANIEMEKGTLTPILLWEISSEDEAKLDKYEGYPKGYDKRELMVSINDTVVSAMAYVMTDKYKISDKIAREWYVEGIVQGYVDAGFDKSEFRPSMMQY